MRTNMCLLLWDRIDKSITWKNKSGFACVCAFFCTSMAPPASGSLLEITVEKCSPYFSPLTLFYEKIGFAFLYHLHPHYYEQAPIVG